MNEQRRILIYRVAMTVAWMSAIYGCILLVDSVSENDTAGWVFFLVPIVLVVGERITRGGEDEDEDETPVSEGDDSGPSPQP